MKMEMQFNSLGIWCWVIKQEIFGKLIHVQNNPECGNDIYPMLHNSFTFLSVFARLLGLCCNGVGVWLSNEKANTHMSAPRRGIANQS